MNEKETIADIAAEIRRGERMFWSMKDCSAFADRIEAAAKRERAITDIMLAVKDKPLPHPDPDNSPPLFFPMTKTQLQTLSDLVAIAHDEMDGLPHYEQELERFDSLLFDMKARYAFDKPYTDPPEHPSNAAAIRSVVERCRDYLADLLTLINPEDENRLLKECDAALAAPARNCDRFKTEGDAHLEYLRIFDHPDPVHYAKWLFATAEGGAE